MYDAIIIGARCAGASTAMLLARHGLDVLLVDRATFPSEIPHGHFIHRHGPARLARWGVLDRILDTGCPAVTSITSDFGDFPLTGDGLVLDGVPAGLGPRREHLDRALVDAAVQAGAELRDGFAVDELTRDGDDRLTGIRGRSVRTGRTATEHARIVIGADGRNSGVARNVGALITESSPTVSCWYFSYWSAPGDALEVHHHDERCVFVFPTHDDLLAVMVSWPIARLAEVRSDIEGHLLAAVDAVPGLGERVRSGRREERLYGATQLPNFVRRPYGPGWALVGDASCHKDPYMALGIGDALRDAELLADALAGGLGGAQPLDDALAGYERARDEATLPAYRENLAWAKLGSAPPQVLALRAAIRDDPEEARRFYLAREEMVAPETYFNRENLARVMAGAHRPAAAA